MDDKPFRVEHLPLNNWADIIKTFEYLTRFSFVYRGHGDASWSLATSIERQFRDHASSAEGDVLWKFVRSAPRLLPAHLVPEDSDAAAWLGLIQHYGGPTRLLDVTLSPYAALFFAFEPLGDDDRAIWAVDHSWCMSACAQIMADAEGISPDETFKRVAGAQMYLVHSVVFGQPYRDRLFQTFKPFTGVFPLVPWKPDARQGAQQAMFLCAANLERTFEENLAAHLSSRRSVYRLTFPSRLRDEVLDQLATMNVTAATLFPDLVGLARSLLTAPVRRERLPLFDPPWEKRRARTQEDVP